MVLPAAAQHQLLFCCSCIVMPSCRAPVSVGPAGDETPAGFAGAGAAVAGLAERARSAVVASEVNARAARRPRDLMGNMAVSRWGWGGGAGSRIRMPVRLWM